MNLSSRWRQPGWEPSSPRSGPGSSWLGVQPYLSYLLKSAWALKGRRQPAGALCSSRENVWVQGSREQASFPAAVSAGFLLLR